MDAAHAEDIAIKALTFIAQDDKLLPRFLDLTGLNVSEIRQAATTPGFFAGVLQFILGHEPTLIEFAASMDIAPHLIAEAHRSLPFGEENHNI